MPDPFAHLWRVLGTGASSFHFPVASCSVAPVVCNSLQPRGALVHQAPLLWDSPSKTTRVSCHALLQGVFPTQGLNLCLLHCKQILLPMTHWGSPSYRLRACKPCPAVQLVFLNTVTHICRLKWQCWVVESVLQLMGQVLCLIIVNRRSSVLLNHLCLRKWLPRLTLP